MEISCQGLDLYALSFQNLTRSYSLFFTKYFNAGKNNLILNRVGKLAMTCFFLCGHYRV